MRRQQVDGSSRSPATSRRGFLKGSAATAAGVWLGGLAGNGVSPAVAETPADRVAPAPHPRLGMNLNGPADWNTELPFVDVFRLSRRWISQRQSAGWGQGPELELDEFGWVKRLEPDCWAETLMCTIDGGHYPSGTYTVLYEGQGEIDFGGSATVRARQPGRMLVDVDAAKGTMFLQLRETNPNDYVRNIRVIMPGFEDSYQRDPFHPVFLDRWQGVACFRFMDWMHTNGSEIRTWNDRPTPQHATFTEKGVALEWMIELCNRQQADAWFCMPHLCDNDFVCRFAEMTKERLDPGLRVHIEYSNEVWNSMFAQTRHSQEMAKQRDLGDPERPWEGGGMYYALRSVEIFDIWQEVFGGTERLSRVLAWQSGNTWWMDRIILPTGDAYRRADVLAIAPYVSMNVPPSGDGLTADEVAGWSVEQTLDWLQENALPKAVDGITRTKELAEEYGLQLMAYEGGQHMVGVGGGENNEKMTQLFHEANRHPRMGEIYDRYYQAWEDAGGDLFCYFSSTGRWSKWGSWGIVEHYDEDVSQSPKFMSTVRWASRCGQPVHLPD